MAKKLYKGLFKTFKIDISIGKFSGEIDLNDYVKVPLSSIANFDELNRHYAKQAAKYAFVATLLAEAKFREAHAKLEIENVEASLDNAIRKKYRDEKLTEGAIKKKIQRNSQYQAAQNTHLEARRQHDLISGLVRAMESKKDMLISLGSNLRRESNMDISIKEEKLKSLTNKNSGDDNGD